MFVSVCGWRHRPDAGDRQVKPPRPVPTIWLDHPLPRPSSAPHILFSMNYSLIHFTGYIYNYSVPSSWNEKGQRWKITLWCRWWWWWLDDDDDCNPASGQTRRDKLRLHWDCCTAPIIIIITLIITVIMTIIILMMMGSQCSNVQKCCNNTLWLIQLEIQNQARYYQLAFCLSLTSFEVYHVRWESVRKY